MRIRCVCGYLLEVDASLAGRRIQCRSCLRVLVVPRPGSDRRGVAEAVTPESLKARRRDILVVLAVSGALVLLLLVLRARTTTVLLATACLALGLQGLRAGAARMVVALAGFLVALAVASALEGAFAGVVRSALGVPLLMSGPVALLVLTTVLSFAAGLASGPLVRRLVGARRLASGWNRRLGLVLGLVEGFALSLVYAWGVAFIQPVAAAARSALAARGERHPLAEAVARAADDARGSLFGRLAGGGASEVPPEAGIVSELAQTAVDESALRLAGEDPAIKALADAPDVRAALERVRGDQQLLDILRRRDLKALLDNPTAVELLRDPALRRLASEHQREIIDALRRARGKALPKNPG